MFITFEGGEGAGKSTLAQKIGEELGKSHEVLFTREPGGTKLGEEVRSLLLHKREEIQVGAKAELFLFLAARIQHIEMVIQPALKLGKVVLCDRFSDSTIAYQGAARGLGIDYTENCTRLAIQDCTPDMTFFVNLDPQIGLMRAGKRTELDHIEKEQLSFHQKVREGFLELARRYPTRIIVLDGTKSKQELFNDAMHHIQKKLQK